MNFFKGLKNKVTSKITTATGIQVSPYPRSFNLQWETLEPFQAIDIYLLDKPKPLAIIVHE